MPDPVPDPDSAPPSRSSDARRWLWWSAAALAALALVAGTAYVARWLDAKDHPMGVCQLLERTGSVAKCVLQRTPLAYGVQAEQVVRFEVTYAGRRAYLGTLARLRDEDRVKQFLRLAAEADMRSARKTAAAAEIGSGGRVSGASIVAALAPVQIANFGRRVVADLKPVYGGPQQAARKQVDAIRARVMQ